MKKCSIDGCEKTYKITRGWCNTHYERWRRHGSPHTVLPAPTPPRNDFVPPAMPGESNPSWRGDAVTYSGMHQRLARIKGMASLQSCPCGSRAAQWAYDHADPDEKTQLMAGYLLPYSTEAGHYIAMCLPCHKKFDLTHIKEIA